MLVLTRKAGESIMIGGLRLTVEEVYFDSATIKLSSKRIELRKRISETEPLVIGEVEVQFKKVRLAKVSLAIRAPKEIKVWRAEVCLA